MRPTQDVVPCRLPDAVTEQAERVQTLWQGSWIAALAVGVVVWGLIIWAVAFHRKRRLDDELPPQMRYNLPIEILYTVVPIIIVACSSTSPRATRTTINEMTGQPRRDRSRSTGFQWSWRSTTEYNGKTAQSSATRPPTTARPALVLPVGQKVEFDLISPDVIHSFWVPAFLFKRDVIPGAPTSSRSRRRPSPATFVGRCAELCGVDHGRMLFQVKLVPPAEFDQYIAQGRQAGECPVTAISTRPARPPVARCHGRRKGRRHRPVDHRPPTTR